VISQIQFPTPLSASISAIIVGKHSKYWIATRGSGLWSYDGNVFKQYAAPEHHFLSNYITNVYEDAAARLWIAFPNGLIVHENDTFKVLSNQTGTYVIRDLPDGRVLIGSDKGLMQYANGELTPLPTNSALDSSSVRSFVINGQTLWAACNRTGVVRYDLNSGKALVINGTKGLKADAVYNIAIDRDGNAWAGTGIGAYKIHVGEGDDVQVTLYGNAQGVGSVESGANAMVRMPDSSIWFGTSQGAVHYVGERTEASGGKVRLIMQMVKLKGEPGIDSTWYESLDAWYDVPNDLRLPTLKNSLSFAFQGVTLSGADKLMYRYRLEGLEKKWSEWSDNTTASYNGLPPGKYVLIVQCRSADGLYTGELKYPFEIITPMILTNWFKYAALLAAVLLGIFLHYLVSVKRAVARRRSERMHREEVAMVRFRTEEDFHDQLGNQLTKISVLTNVLRNKVPNSPDTLKVLSQIKENTDRLYDDARDILWLQKDENANLYDVLLFIREYGEALFKDTQVNFLFSKVDEKWVNRRLPLDVSHNVVMIFKEALLNCRKHSKASNVSIEVILRRKDVLQFVMRDDGQGFDMQAERYNIGIVSMTSRAARLGGRLYIDTRPGKGVIISLTFRLPK
jgi:signal transduction histidine kinase